ncbi:MAG: carboxymuconolactone decarboxylase family protein [Candidatus Acidiferrales bacterium]
MEQLKRDYTKVELSEPDRAMLDYVVTITKDATQVGPCDHRRLRAAGFDDTGILQITLIASWFNYINRAADALGVGREPADATASVAVSAANPAGGPP